MDCFGCEIKDCEMQVANDQSWLNRCTHCAYIALVRINESCRVCFGQGCGFLGKGADPDGARD